MTGPKDLEEFRIKKKDIEMFLKSVDASAELLSSKEIEKKFFFDNLTIQQVIDKYKDNIIDILLIAYYLLCKELQEKTDDIPNKK